LGPDAAAGRIEWYIERELLGSQDAALCHPPLWDLKDHHHYSPWQK